MIRVLIFLIPISALLIGCSEGSLYTVPSNFDDKERSLISQNLNYIQSKMEKVNSEISGFDILYSSGVFSVNPFEITGNAEFNFQNEDNQIVKWSTTNVEIFKSDIRKFVDGEEIIFEDVGTVMIASPNGLNYDYEGQINFYLYCVEEPPLLGFNPNVSCGFSWNDYLLIDSWENDIFSRLNSRISYGLQSDKFSVYKRKENNYNTYTYLGERTTGWGNIMKYLN